MKLRFKYEKLGYIRYIGHLDTFRLFQRCLKRIGAPVIFSGGFNPHPKLALGIPLPLGMASEGEFFDVELAQDYDWSDIDEKLNDVLPEGMRILDVYEEVTGASIESLGSFAKILLQFPNEEAFTSDDVSNIIEKVLNSKNLMIRRKRKKGKKKIIVEEDIRSGLKTLEAGEISEEGFELIAVITIGESDAIRPVNLVEAIIEAAGLNIERDYVMMTRLSILKEDMGEM